jgi:hypothetical protein
MTTGEDLSPPVSPASHDSRATLRPQYIGRSSRNWSIAASREIAAAGVPGADLARCDQHR